MNSVKKSEDLSDKIKVALDKAIQKPIAEEKNARRLSRNFRQKGGIKKCLLKIYNIQNKNH